MSDLAMKNLSGLRAVGHAILTLPVPPKSKTIIVPDTVRKRTAMIDNEVTVIEIGPDAWQGKTRRAEVGDVVLVTSMAGYMATGKDDQMYRVVNDEDVFLRKEF